MSRERQTATPSDKRPLGPKKKEKGNIGPGRVLLGRSLAVLFVCVFRFGCLVFLMLLPKVASHGVDVDGEGEVHVKSMVWLPKISFNDGRYVIRPFECKIIGKAEGNAKVKACIHTLFTTFDDEEWQIHTALCHIIGHSAGSFTAMVMSDILQDPKFGPFFGCTRATAIAMPSRLFVRHTIRSAKSICTMYWKMNFVYGDRQRKMWH